jgi:hypothetical protein
MWQDLRFLRSKQNLQAQANGKLCSYVLFKILGVKNICL